jgi:hypothetical protein
MPGPSHQRRPPLFWCQSRGWAAANHAAPLDRRVGPTPPRLAAAWHHPWPVPHHFTPLLSPLVLPHERARAPRPPPSPLSVTLCPRPPDRTIAAAAALPFLSPLVSSPVLPSSALLDRASPPPSPPLVVRPRRCPTRPPELCHRVGPFSLPHRCRPSPIRTPLPHLA